MQGSGSEGQVFTLLGMKGLGKCQLLLIDNGSGSRLVTNSRS